MHVETKFIRLRKQAAVGDDIDGWLGGWGRDQLFYLVMVARDGLDPAGVTFRCGADAER